MDSRESNFVIQGSSERLVLSSVLHTSRAKLLLGQLLLLSSVQRVAKSSLRPAKMVVAEACSKLENVNHGDTVWRNLYIFYIYTK